MLHSENKNKKDKKWGHHRLNNKNIPNVFLQVGFGRLVCKQTLPLPYGGKDVVFDKPSSTPKIRMRGKLL